MFCANCGTKNDDSANFCLNCGNPMQKPVTVETQAIVETAEETVATESVAAESAAAEDTVAAESAAAEETVAAESVAAEETVERADVTENTVNEEVVQESVAPVQNTINAETTNIQQKQLVSDITYTPAKENFFQKNKKLVIGGAIALVVIIGLIIFFVTRPLNIKPNDYLKLEFSGYEGYGKVKVSFDTTKFKTDYHDKIKLKQQNVGNASTGNEQLDELIKSLAGSGSTNVDYAARLGSSLNSSKNLEGVEGVDLNKLKNGDKVSVTWDESSLGYLEKIYGIKIERNPHVVAVSGLQTVSEINPFDFLTVVPSGADKAGKITLESSNPDIKFTASKTSGLSNGDKVKVTARMTSSSSTDAKVWIEKIGAAPSQLELEYEVTGLGQYILDIGSIDDKAWASLKEAAETYIDENVVAKNDQNHATVGSKTLVGSALHTPQSSSSVGNYLYMLYKVTVNVSYSEANFSTATDRYVIVRLAKVAKNGAGEISFDTSRSITNGSSRFEVEYKAGSKYNFTLKGEEDLEKAKNRILKNSSMNISSNFAAAPADQEKKEEASSAQAAA